MLSEDDLRLLTIAKQVWRYEGAKAETVRREPGLSMARYWQELSALRERPEALAAEPMLVNRIDRRRRESQECVGDDESHRSAPSEVAPNLT